jgi:hypothetical protein
MLTSTFGTVCYGGTCLWDRLRLVFPVAPVGWVNDQGGIRFRVYPAPGAPPTGKHQCRDVVATTTASSRSRSNGAVEMGAHSISHGLTPHRPDFDNNQPGAGE